MQNKWKTTVLLQNTNEKHYLTSKGTLLAQNRCGKWPFNCCVQSRNVVWAEGYYEQTLVIIYKPLLYKQALEKDMPILLMEEQR